MSIDQRKELDVFFHMLYELDKGIRGLALLTTKDSNLEAIMEKLSESSYHSIIEKLNSNYINVFFGEEEQIKVIQKMKKNSLKDLNPEEDFILGVLLGYNTSTQCKRYLEKTS
ncbi:DUF2023 family protein [Fusobacterium sp. MFO224]|uniref:DUF2023 family protein n=1 Tax=Fusobacterium sp. MFO224 TaxID=3378070 RepID=UPI003853B021